jgi:phosphoglycolate phosphatase
MGRGELADVVIAFDLDGTLADTAPDIARALNETLDLEGLAHLRPLAVRSMIGRGARALIEHATGAAGAHFTGERLNQLTEAFIAFYRADIARQSTLYPGVPEALAELTGAGAKLAVCTNKRTDLSTLLLQKLGVGDRFSAIVGADAVAERKPHPEHYRAAISRAGGTVRRSLMVGDSAADITAARGAGAPAIGVSFGYGADVGAEALGADRIISHYAQLPAACRALLA